MSITEKTPRTAGAPASGPHGSGRPRARKALALGAGLAVLAGGSVAVALHESRSSSPAASATTPLTLPDQLAGLPAYPDAQDQLRGAMWRDKAVKATGNAVVTGRMYGTGGTSRSIRAVAARTDLTGKLELAWAADEGHPVGKARCTQNVQLVPGGRVGVRPTMIVCWRKGDGLTAYTVTIDPRATLTDADGAAAIEALWTAVGRG